MENLKLKITKKDNIDIYEAGDTTIYDPRDNKSTTPTSGVEINVKDGKTTSRIVCFVCKLKTIWNPSKEERDQFVHHICQVKGDEERK
jgi:hypothetical protein